MNRLLADNSLICIKKLPICKILLVPNDIGPWASTAARWRINATTPRRRMLAWARNGYEMPPADFRFNKTKTDYWRGRSEEARVFAESMGHNEPKAIMLRIAEEYEMIARWCEKQTGDRQCRKNLGQGAN
jgi:hypothetical protein